MLLCAKRWAAKARAHGQPQRLGLPMGKPIGYHVGHRYATCTLCKNQDTKKFKNK